MKHLINKNTGATLAVDDKKALELMKTGMFEYISKTEFKNKPDYLQAGITQWIPIKSSNINSVRYSPKHRLCLLSSDNLKSNLVINMITFLRISS